MLFDGKKERRGIKFRDIPRGSDRIHLQCRRPGFDPRVGMIPWRSEWQPTPVFLPGNSHGQRSLAGYSPGGRKELDTTERLTLSFPHFTEINYVQHNET